jgi:hypothetical protein
MYKSAISGYFFFYYTTLLEGIIGVAESNAKERSKRKVYLEEIMPNFPRENEFKPIYSTFLLDFSSPELS